MVVMSKVVFLILKPLIYLLHFMLIDIMFSRTYTVLVYSVSVEWYVHCALG